MAQPEHPDWKQESSLTTPADRDREKGWRPDQGAAPLTEPEAAAALDALNNTSFTDKFPRVDRTYADPPVPMQTIGLVSFTPAKGATPNADGVYGFAKLRGNYATSIEANQRAEWLIRNADSYHQVYHTYVGRPFPITFSSRYSAETAEIDIRKQTTEAISSSVKEQKDNEQKEVQDMHEREQALLAESEKAREDDGTGDPHIDPYENYITLCVKKAQLSWTFLEHLTKMKEVRDILIKTREELECLDKEYPDYRDQYFEKYMDARKTAGFEGKKATEGQDNFIKFMVEDAVIPTIDTDEVLPVSKYE
jgi:hypothetical protein